MEDAHTTVLNIDGSETEKNAFFAVYDGHGGASYNH
jgi:protein phosphatase 2C family protein 2/3